MAHAAHILNSLHRALGFPGRPTDPAWPPALSAYPCLPVPGVVVPLPSGATAVGLVTGWCLPEARMPYTVLDDVEGMHAVVEVPAGNPTLVMSSRFVILLFCLSHLSLRSCASRLVML
jgi:hypothetical protein